MKQEKAAKKKMKIRKQNLFLIIYFLLLYDHVIFMSNFRNGKDAQITFTLKYEKSVLPSFKYACVEFDTFYNAIYESSHHSLQ